MVDDVRFALCALLRRKAVTALIVSTLAVGIAASTAVFSVADAILWHPLPFQEPSCLVSLWSYDPARRTTTRGMRLAALDAWTGKDQILENLHAFTMRAVHLSGNGDAEAVTASVVSPGLFAALGVRPRLGREFDAQDVADATGGCRTQRRAVAQPV